MEKLATVSGFNGTDDAAERELSRLRQAASAIRTELGKIIVGQDRVMDLMLISLFSGGHSLLVGVPGLAKTLLVSSLAKCLNLSFGRIQFTPDLMPSDITGTDILQDDPIEKKRSFHFMKGPIFCNLLLADEINRTPPKTQAALLQAMQEGKVTAGGRDYVLEKPFFVFATQNPIEQEGTYPLPEAQLDRFLFQIDVGYPTFEDEMKVAERGMEAGDSNLSPVLGPRELMEFQALARKIPIAPTLLETATRLIRKTRPEDPNAPDVVKKYLAWGAGPRATQNLIIAAKVRAALDGRFSVGFSDLEDLLPCILEHRILRNFHADADGIKTSFILEKILEGIRAA